ncbi:daunorubicin/doxorubicin resistance ABC transporter ATP-binding protein DrrA, partial [Streptomyces thermolilacinus]
GAPHVAEAGRRVHAQVRDRVEALTEVARVLRDEGVRVEDIGLRRPTLDDVFLRLTGAEADPTAAAPAARTPEGAAA